MSNPNVDINGVTYNAVPSVEIPIHDSENNAVFHYTGDDNAAVGNVLSGKTFHSAGGSLTGSMANNGDTSGTINKITGSGSTVSIPSGYTSGGTVSIDSTEAAKVVSGNIKSGVTMFGVSGSSMVVDTTISSDAAGAGNIASGKKAFVNGAEITGSLTAVTVSQDSSSKVLTIS